MIWNCYHFKIWNTKFIRNQHTFKNHEQKNSHVFGQLQAFIITICKKHCSNIHLYEKVIFGQKEMQSFVKATHLPHCISFATTCQPHKLMWSRTWESIERN
jgi:hypothetical protein